MKSLRLKKARNYAVAEQKWWWYVVNTNILELHVNNNLSTSTFRSGKDVLVFWVWPTKEGEHWSPV